MQRQDFNQTMLQNLTENWGLQPKGTVRNIEFVAIKKSMQGAEEERNLQPWRSQRRDERARERSGPAVSERLPACNCNSATRGWIYAPGCSYRPLASKLACRSTLLWPAGNTITPRNRRGEAGCILIYKVPRAPFLVVLFFLPPSCSLAYQSLGSVQGNACELSFLNDVPAPADKPCYRGLGTEQQQSDTLRFCFCQVKNEKTTNLCQRIVKNLPEFPYKTRSKHGPIPETRGPCGV